MKKITLLVVGVLVSAFTFAGGSENPPKTASGMAVVKRDDKSFKVIYKSEQESDVKVEIFNTNKELVFQETIKKSSGFSRPYSLSNMDEGEYTVRLDNGSNWMSGTVKMGKTEKLARLIHMNDGKYLLMVPGTGEDKIHVEVTDNNGETIYSGTTPVYGDFAQVFDMGTRHSDFSFEVSDEHGATTTLFK